MLTAKEAVELSNNAEHYNRGNVYEIIHASASIGKRSAVFVSFKDKQEILKMVNELKLNGFDVHTEELVVGFVTRITINW